MGIEKLRIALFSLTLGSFLLLASGGPVRADHVQFYVDALPPYAVLHDDGPPTGFAVALMEPFDAHIRRAFRCVGRFG